MTTHSKIVLSNFTEFDTQKSITFNNKKHYRLLYVSGEFDCLKYNLSKVFQKKFTNCGLYIDEDNCIHIFDEDEVRYTILEIHDLTIEYIEKDLTGSLSLDFTRFQEEIFPYLI